VIAYTRTQGAEQYTVILNFSQKAACIKESARALFKGEVVVSNVERASFHGALEPYEAVVLKEDTRK